MSGLKRIKQKYVAILETYFYRYKLHLEMIRIRMRRTFIIIIIKSVMQYELYLPITNGTGVQISI